MIIKILLYSLLINLSLNFSNELKFSLNSTLVADPVTKKIIYNIAKELSKRTSIIISLIEYPAERAIRQANLGKTDGDFGRIKEITDMYKNLVIVPESFLSFDYYAFSKGEKNIKPTWEILKDYKVIGNLGSKVPENMLKGKMRKGIYETPPGTVEILFKMLLKDYCDFVVASDIGVKYFLKEVDKKNEIFMYPEPLSSLKLYIALNKQKIDFLKPISAALRAMKNDGTLKKIIQNSN